MNLIAMNARPSSSPPTSEADEAIDATKIRQLSVHRRRAAVDAFVKSATADLDFLHERVQSGAYDGMWLAVHTIKGNCMLLGARRVVDMCEALRGRTMGKEEWEAELVSLRAALQQVFDFLEQAVGNDS